MMITIVSLIVLLLCFALVRSTVLTLPGKKEEPKQARLNVLWCLICVVLCLIDELTSWTMTFAAPVFTVFWLCTNGWDKYTDIEISDESLIGKILLFKI